MKKRIQSTIWLDLLTYIILPLVVLKSSWNIISSISYLKWNLYTIVLMIVEVSLIVFYSLTVYHSHKRTALAPKLLRALFWITAIQASFDFANTEQINKGYNLFLTFGLYFAACYVVWIRTNEVYLENRKEIFGKESTLKKNYRCPNCKRLVPIGKDCPHCKKDDSVEEKLEEKKVNKTDVKKKEMTIEKKKEEKPKKEESTKKVDKDLTKKEN